MKVRYSKSFTKAVDRLSGKQLKSVLGVIEEVKATGRLEDVTDCMRLVGYRNIYRIRIGSLRAFLTLHIEIMGGVAHFQFLVSRGQAYTKKTETELKRIDA